jgi:Ca-activated chloride channel family protein
VDQVFVNDNAIELEGEYLFPLPEGATISRFALWVDGRKLEAEVLTRDEARRIYEQIVREQRDPALLEYAERGAFRARIYPIPARGEKRVELEYSEVLAQDQGLVRYAYPLNTEKFSTRPLAEVSVAVRIASRQPLKAIYSPSHEVQVLRQGELGAQVTYKATQITPNKDFLLYYSVAADDLGLNLLSFREGAEKGFFLLLLAPRAEARAQEVVARDVTLVLDTSGSMRGEKLAQAKGAAKGVLNALNSQDRFNIIAFSTSVNRFAREVRPATERAEGVRFIGELNADGGTDIQSALAEALRPLPSGRPQVVIFLTDGLPTVGETRIERILERMGSLARAETRIFCFGVGYDVNTTLLDTLAQDHHGMASYVRPEEDIEVAVSSFYTKISTPVLSEVQLDFGGVTVEDAYPYPLPDLFAGGQIVMVGRYRQGGETTVTLRGTINGRPVSYAFPGVRFSGRGGQEFIPRLWATRKIGHLLTQIRLKGGTPERELVDEIVALSVRYGIVTPYTSFLVDETEDALSASGRKELAARQVAPPSTSAPGQSAPKTGGMLPAPSASGAQSVEKSIAQQALRSADVAAEAPAEQLRVVGERTFVLRRGAWTDTTFDAAKMTPEQVAFGSARYFALLAQHPEWGRTLALGTHVVLVWEGRAYEVGATGEPSAPTPAPTATPRTEADPWLWRWLKGWLR